MAAFLVSPEPTASLAKPARPLLVSSHRAGVRFPRAKRARGRPAPPSARNPARPMGDRFRLSRACRRAGIPAFARTACAYLGQSHALRAIRLLGHLVAVRPPQHGFGWPRLVRALLSRGDIDRGGEPVRQGPCDPPLDHLERLALRGFCHDHDLWADGQRLPISQAGAAHSRRIDFWRDRHRLSLWPQQTGLVPLSLPGQWRLRLTRQACAGAFRRRSGGLGPVAPIRQCRGAGGQLRAARRDQDHARRLRLPYVRPLQRLSRRDQPGAALAQS